MPRSITCGAALALLLLAGCPESSGGPDPFEFEDMDSGAGPADADDALKGCSDLFVEQTEGLLNVEPSPGFDENAPSNLPDSLTIARVEDDRLELQGPGVSPSVAFHWRGPDLTDHFDVGETVEAERARSGHSVENEANMAVAYPGHSAFNLPVLQLGTGPGSVGASVHSPCGAGTVQHGVDRRMYRALVAERDTKFRVHSTRRDSLHRWLVHHLPGSYLSAG